MGLRLASKPRAGDVMGLRTMLLVFIASAPVRAAPVAELLLPLPTSAHERQRAVRPSPAPLPEFHHSAERIHAHSTQSAFDHEALRTQPFFSHSAFVHTLLCIFLLALLTSCTWHSCVDRRARLRASAAVPYLPVATPVIESTVVSSKAKGKAKLVEG